MLEQEHPNDAARPVNTDWAALVLQNADPELIGRAVRGLLAVLASFDQLNKDGSEMALLFHRIGLLAKACYLPDSGTFDVTALQFLMGGSSDDTVRRMANRSGVAKYQPSGRTMYRSSEIARGGYTGEPDEAGENASE